MATKTAKIKELKDIRPEAITQEDLNKLQTTVRTMDRLTADVGRMEIQKFQMMTAMGTVQADIDSMRVEFTEKYGSDNVNIQTGEISYPEETTEDGEVNS